MASEELLKLFRIAYPKKFSNYDFYLWFKRKGLSTEEMITLYKQLMEHGGISCSGTFQVVQAKGPQLWRKVYKLHMLANMDNNVYFLKPHPHLFTVYLLLCGNGEAVGYAAWNNHEDGTPVLRQMYLLPQHRRQGLGTFLFKKSREMFSNSENFYIEIPLSKGAVQMFVKLGYVRVDGEYLIGEKGVKFVQGF